MSRAEKLLVRLLSQPKDFTYSELKTILSSFGYVEVQGAGSRVCFKSETHKIKLHKPHPGIILKQYQVSLIIEELKKEGLI
ncbi:MAG: type II toxin-antitoxin system HicA family toxin [Paludibacter sp.]